MIPKRELLELAAESNIAPHVVEKDYVLGWLLAGIHQHPHLRESWVFKGGTCLKKCYFETYRFSEDLDFTLRDANDLDDGFLSETFRDISEFVYDQAGIEIPVDRIVFEIFQNPQGRTIAQGRIYYRGPLAPASPRSWPRIKLDLTADEIVVDAPVENTVRHGYSDEPADGIHAFCYSYTEVFAEKIRALGERTRPRDLYDVINFFRRPESPELGGEVRRILLEKCRYKSVPVPRFAELSSHREECAVGWNDQLAHQLQSLPPFDSFWEELPSFFAWLERPDTASTGPVLMPIQGTEEPLARWRNVRSGGMASSLSLLDRIRFAAANRLVVELDYRKENGEQKTYRIEPYSLRESREGNILLYAVKLPAPDPSGAIRGFRTDRMLNARITDQSFTPRYRIDFIPEGPRDSAALPALRQPAARPKSRMVTGAFSAPKPRSPKKPRKPASPKGFTSGPKYVFQCPFCSKKFTRKSMDSKLHAHKQKNGMDCPGRTGMYVTTKY